MLGVVAEEERGRNLWRNNSMIVIVIAIRVVVMIIEKIKMVVVLIIIITIVRITFMRGMGEDCEL